MDDYKHIRELANTDVTTLRKKNEDYGASWRKRGGQGAFMMLARKWDRIETQCQQAGYDVFGVIQKELDAGITKDGLLDDIRDLRAYLLLVESHMTAPKCGDGILEVKTGDHGHPRGTTEDRARKRTLQEIAEGEPGPGYVSQDPDATPVGRCFGCGSEGLYHPPHCPTQAQPRQA